MWKSRVLKRIDCLQRVISNSATVSLAEKPDGIVLIDGRSVGKKGSGRLRRKRVQRKYKSVGMAMEGMRKGTTFFQNAIVVAKT